MTVVDYVDGGQGRRQVKRDADALMEQFAGYFAPAGATDREDLVAQELRLLL